MTQKTSPWIEASYGWEVGEGGWNTGMDKNITSFSFLLSDTVDGIVTVLPNLVNGQAYYLTTDNRFYYAADGLWSSVPCPLWYTFKIKSTGQIYKFNGSTLELVKDNQELDNRIEQLEDDFSSLGSASLLEADDLASSADLDIVSAQANNYSDQVVANLAEEIDPHLIKMVSDYPTVQSAVDASAGGTLIFDVPVTVTSMVTLPSIIRLVVQELITFTGDQDYWFYADSPQAIVITEWRSTQSNPFSGRTKYNRQLRIDNPALFSIDYAEIDEASTGIHCLFGEVFRAGIIKLTNLRGTEAQYGYGVNSSARISRINTVIAENDAPGDGRHVIYINGDVWEDVEIGSVRCKNIHRNPLNILQTSVTAKARFKLGSFYADGCNIGALNNTTSCVHFPEPTSPDVKVDIGDIHVTGSVGAVSSASSLSGGIYSLNSFNVNNVTVDSPASGSQWQVMIRGSKRPRVGFVQSTELPAGSQGLLRFRQCLDGLVETAILEGAVGTGTVNILDGSATIGRIDSPGVTPMVATNSTIKSLNLFNDSFVNVGDSATPSVSGIKKAFNAAGSAVSITNFLSGVDGQDLTFVASTGNTTIVHSTAVGGITTKSGGDVVLGTRGLIRLVRYNERWLEI